MLWQGEVVVCTSLAAAQMSATTSTPNKNTACSVAPCMASNHNINKHKRLSHPRSTSQSDAT